MTILRALRCEMDHEVEMAGGLREGLCMAWTRRRFLGTCAGIGATALLRRAEAVTETRPACGRVYHLSVSMDALDADPGLLAIVQKAGVTDLWLTGFLYGHWHYSLERMRQWRERVIKLGMNAHVCNVPLGHPGDSLGAMDGTVPLTPPKHWRMGCRADGSLYAGTSLHPPATEENVQALQQLHEIGVRQVFLDDDFRLATSPGMIGGCFCDDHREQFLKSRGYDTQRWNDLLDAVHNRKLTGVMREWVDFTCDQLTASFRAQQAAMPSGRLGNMVMYFGAEKAGIRLADYKDVPLRVGELMFNDDSFAPIKNKTAELFSALFHRRFVSPELAFSETTAFPADRLSARNMAAKLAVSTLCDVRHTMFMSGLTAVPIGHWDTLGPAMRKHARIHPQIAGHSMRGPFKHYWGEHSRFVGDDNPNSLFLAVGVPFEVTAEPARDGWTFLSEHDAGGAAAGHLRSRGTTFVTRSESPTRPEGAWTCQESLQAMFDLKRKLLPQLANVPFVEEEKPVVCAWYPGARAVLLWNLAEQRERFTIRFKEVQRQVTVEGLDIELVEDIG